MGDFVSRLISGHEGRGVGKSTTPGGREKHAYFLKSEFLETGMEKRALGAGPGSE
jgi:hypothetical protein